MMSDTFFIESRCNLKHRDEQSFPHPLLSMVPKHLKIINDTKIVTFCQDFTSIYSSSITKRLTKLLSQNSASSQIIYFC